MSTTLGWILHDFLSSNKTVVYIKNVTEFYFANLV